MLVWVSSCGSSRLTPVSVDIDQLLCLPEPFTPANGFSCSSAWRPYAGRHPLERLHQQHLVIAGDVAGLEQRRDLVLARRHLVVAGLDRHAEPVQLLLGFGHEGEHPGRDGAEVVILQLLTLGRLGAEQGALADEQVGPLVVQLPVDQEVLLLRAHGGDDAGDACVGAEDPEDAHRLLGERLDRAEQRDLGVQRLAGPGDERRRDAQRHVVVTPHQEGRAGGVPGGVAAGLEGGPEPARGKAGGIRLALDQLGAGEVEDHSPAPVRAGERVVLLGGQAGERLEPVGVVARAVLDGPVLHRRRDHVGHGGIERLTVIDGAKEAAIHLLGEPLPHDAAGEDVGAEDGVDPSSATGPPFRERAGVVTGARASCVEDVGECKMKASLCHCRRVLPALLRDRRYRGPEARCRPGARGSARRNRR